MRSVNCLIVAGLLLISLLGPISLLAADNPSNLAGTARFKNKIVAIATRNSNPLDEGLTIHFVKNAGIQQIGGRYFFVGTTHIPLSQASYPQQTWKKGAEVGIALDQVKKYTVYSLEDFARTVFERPPTED